MLVRKQTFCCPARGLSPNRAQRVSLANSDDHVQRQVEQRSSPLGINDGKASFYSDSEVRERNEEELCVQRKPKANDLFGLVRRCTKPAVRRGLNVGRLWLGASPPADRQPPACKGQLSVPSLFEKYADKWTHAPRCFWWGDGKQEVEFLSIRDASPSKDVLCDGNAHRAHGTSASHASPDPSGNPPTFLVSFLFGGGPLLCRGGESSGRQKARKKNETHKQPMSRRSGKGHSKHDDGRAGYGQALS